MDEDAVRIPREQAWSPRVLDDMSVDALSAYADQLEEELERVRGAIRGEDGLSEQSGLAVQELEASCPLESVGGAASGAVDSADADGVCSSLPSSRERIAPSPTGAPSCSAIGIEQRTPEIDR